MNRKKKKKPLFNRHERAIMKVAYGTGRPMSIKEISEKTDMSWVTGRKYSKRLVNRKWLEPSPPRKVEFNYPLLGIKRRKKRKK